MVHSRSSNPVQTSRLERLTLKPTAFPLTLARTKIPELRVKGLGFMTVKLNPKPPPWNAKKGTNAAHGGSLRNPRPMNFQ